MKISVITEIFHSVKAKIANLQCCRFHSLLIRMSRCKNLQFYIKKLVVRALFISFFVIVFYASGISKVLAGVIESAFPDILMSHDDLKGEWIPEIPQPIQETEDAFPGVSHSTMLSLAQSYYRTKEETTIADLDSCAGGILLELERRNQALELFELPTDFVIKEAFPIQQFYTTESIDEYDGQILDAWQDASENHSALSFHRIGITALDALYLLKKNENITLNVYIYYAELAFFGFGNEYIIDRPIGGDRADWFYRVAQVFDYLGLAADNQNPPLRHEMYFISAAFLYLSFETLEKFDFNEKNSNLYRHNIWELDFDMLYRLGTYLDHHEDFFNRLREHIDIIRNLELTDEQKNKVQEITDKVDEWERVFNYQHR